MRLLLILFAIYSNCSFAHKDTGLELQHNGSLAGLPNKYEPSSFDLESFTLEIAGKKLIIPECVRRHVGFNKPNYSLDFTASWYHNSTTLPPYMNIIITPETGGFYYYLILNLDTLALIGAHKWDKPNNIIGFASRMSIELQEQCLRSFKLGTVEINT